MSEPTLSELLRAAASTGDGGPYICDLMTRAADEIECLNHEVDNLEDRLDQAGEALAGEDI